MREHQDAGPALRAGVGDGCSRYAYTRTPTISEPEISRLHPLPLPFVHPLSLQLGKGGFSKVLRGVKKGKAKNEGRWAIKCIDMDEIEQDGTQMESFQELKREVRGCLGTSWKRVAGCC